MHKRILLPVSRLFASIQTRLLAVFLVNALLTVLLVVAFNQWLRNQLIKEADNHLLTSATGIADKIDEFNRNNKQVFHVGSRLPQLLDFLQADEAQRSDPEFRDRTLITLDSLEVEPWDEYYVLSQAIIDRNGRNILDTASANIGADESQQDYFRATLMGGSINISPIQYRPEWGGIYFYYAVPLRENDPSQSVIGVLRIQISISSIQNIVFDTVRRQNLDVALFDENFVRVVDTQHEDLLFRSVTRYSAEQIATLRSQYALPPLPDQNVSVPVSSLVNALSNSYQKQVMSGYTSPDSDQKERLAIVRLETVPWYLVASKPASQFFRPVQQQTTGILILAFFLTVIAFVSSYLISRLITKPIRVLTAAAKQVAGGSLHIQAPITSSDEVGTLAKAFNQMTAEIEISRATLEERVIRRTQELVETNEKLKHEIVERKRYEKQALELALEQESRRILSEFIQKASHEFRTPLSIINTRSYLVKRLLPDEKRPHMDVIEEQSKYIDGLVNRMVLMSHLDSILTTPAEDVQMDELMRTVYTSTVDSFKKMQASLQLDLRAPNTLVCADPELLSIAVQNILDNALRYSDKPAEVSLGTYTLNGMVSIIIKDNGIGIPEALHERVFERFFRVDEAHTTRGFGLGLPIAKRIVENIGGSIDLDSAVGRGTTVTITLDIKN